jgi:glycosyltransferase involved in cell wall biosynthesis
MHAAFVLPRFFPYRGGYENSMLAIAKRLMSRGHRVTVFTTNAEDLESLWLPGYKTYPASEVEVDDIRVRRFAVSYNRLARRLTRFAGLVPYWRWKAQYWRPAFHVPGLRAALHSIDADVFHVGPMPYGCLIYAGIEAAEYRQLPVIATPCIHFGEETNSEVAQHYANRYQIALLQHCDRVLCMTETEKRKLTALGVPAQKLAVTGHGIDLSLATGGDGETLRKRHRITGPVVFHMGMKAYEKGSQAVVEAMKLLWQRGSDAWLVMAGPSLREFDEYLARNAANCPRLVHLGPFGDEERRDLLAAADIVVQPSRVESLGLVLLEAWANAKPVIAADIAVSRELVEGASGGSLVPFGDAQRLADEIARLLANTGLRTDMGIRGQRFAQNYDGEKLWTRNAEEIEKVGRKHGL